MMTVGQLAPGSFDPSAFLTHFDTGKVSRLPSGQVLREYELVAEDREIEVAPGVFYPAWTYNGQVPGPTIRCTEGDRLRVRFVNKGSHSHSIHFHGIHPSSMDGAFEPVHPRPELRLRVRRRAVRAAPVPLPHRSHQAAHPQGPLRGVHHRSQGRAGPPAREMVMVMNGFDTNFDRRTRSTRSTRSPFTIRSTRSRSGRDELVRVYLVNVTEFDLLNSFHIHGNLFRLYRTGTDLQRYEWTDIVALCQGERAVLEFTYKHPGPFMFHAHQSEFAELGWSGIFLVQAPHV